MSGVKTLSEFIIEKQDDFPFASGELTRLLNDIVIASKIVNREVNKAGLANILGATTQENIQGETQQKLDVFADDQFIAALKNGGEACGIASEENDDFLAFDSLRSKNGKYIVAFDPLDGSSNIDVNGQIGTIFTIYPTLPDLPANSPEQFLQGGRAQLVAGYVLYGPSTILVMTTGGPTRGFTLDLTHGGFLLTTPEFKIPTTTNEYALNMANYPFWTSQYQSHFGPLFVHNKTSSAPTLRWNAAMVGDVHRVISRGGVYFYPGDKRDNMAQGKLRLLYEANPMAWLTENAGGTAVAEAQPILDITPSSLHQRTPVLLGSSQTVLDIVKA